MLVVGDVVDDLVVNPVSPVTRASDTNAEIRMHPGGSAANVAAWLGWLGAEVTFVGRAGKGGADRHRDALASLGVDARITEDPDRTTATIVLTIDGHGERTMYVDRGANAALNLHDLPSDAWDGTGWLHLTGYSLFDDGVRPTALALLAEARRRGIGTSIDPSSVAFLAECGAASFLSWTHGVDIVFPNEAEAALLTGHDAPDVMARELGRTYDNVVLTLGAAGSMVRSPVGHVVRRTAAEAKVVDTTGAGDAFCAGFLAGWDAQFSREECLRVAREVAAIAVGKTGARPA